MSLVRIHASPKQLSKLRNGHKVRVKGAMEGEGFCMIVHPERYDLLSRTFDRGLGMEIQLSPEEIVANKEAEPEIKGSGIFGKTGDKLLKKAGVKSLAYKVGDIAKPHLKKAIDSGLHALAESTGHPEFAKPLAHMASHVASDFLDHPSKYHNMVSSNAGGPRAAHAAHTLAGQVAQNHLYDQMNQHLGTQYGKLAESAMGNAAAHMSRAGMEARHLHGRGFGLGVKREVGSVGRHGSFVAHQASLPPALQSQPFSANFSMANQLPPSYQRFSRGSGLYA